VAVVDRWAEQVRLAGGRTDVAGSSDADAPALVRTAVDALLGVAL
jgi:hypothetical protein